MSETSLGEIFPNPSPNPNLNPNPKKNSSKVVQIGHIYSEFSTDYCAEVCFFKDRVMAYPNVNPNPNPEKIFQKNPNRAYFRRDPMICNISCASTSQRAETMLYR